MRYAMMAILFINLVQICYLLVARKHEKSRIGVCCYECYSVENCFGTKDKDSRYRKACRYFEKKSKENGGYN